MKDLTIQDVNVDFAVLSADYLVDSGLLDSLINRTRRMLGNVPARLVAWLGPDIRTPDNSNPPSVTIPGPGPWNGVVFVESDEASYWLLVKASPGKTPPDFRGSEPFRSQTPLGQQSRAWPDSEPVTASRWPEDPLQNERDPWDREPWRR